jgi:hypothetical protein
MNDKMNDMRQEINYLRECVDGRSAIDEDRWLKGVNILWKHMKVRL